MLGTTLYFSRACIPFIPLFNTLTQAKQKAIHPFHSMPMPVQTETETETETITPHHTTSYYTRYHILQFHLESQIPRNSCSWRFCSSSYKIIRKGPPWHGWVAYQRIINQILKSSDSMSSSLTAHSSLTKFVHFQSGGPAWRGVRGVRGFAYAPPRHVDQGCSGVRGYMWERIIRSVLLEVSISELQHLQGWHTVPHCHNSNSQQKKANCRSSLQ